MMISFSEKELFSYASISVDQKRSALRNRNRKQRQQRRETCSCCHLDVYGSFDLIFEYLVDPSLTSAAEPDENFQPWHPDRDHFLRKLAYRQNQIRTRSTLCLRMWIYLVTTVRATSNYHSRRSNYILQKTVQKRTTHTIK